MPTGPQPIQLMMAPFPEGWNGDLDQQWQQAVQLLEGSVYVTGATTPTKLAFSFLTNWPTGWKGDINQTWAMGISMITVAAGASVIPLTITAFPDGFQGTLNETWQQAITQITGAVP